MVFLLNTVIMSLDMYVISQLDCALKKQNNLFWFAK